MSWEEEWKEKVRSGKCPYCSIDLDVVWEDFWTMRLKCKKCGVRFVVLKLDGEVIDLPKDSSLW